MRGRQRVESDRSALQVLRAHTATAHRALDSSLAGPDLVLADNDSYIRLLTVLSELHDRTERALRAWVGATPWARTQLAGIELPDRAHLYRHDLAELGRPRITSPSPDSPYDDAAGIAALYLLAGSGMGSRALLSRLPEHVGVDCRRGLRDATSPHARRFWPAVRRLLDAHLATTHPATHHHLAHDAAQRAAAMFEELHAMAVPTELRVT